MVIANLLYSFNLRKQICLLDRYSIKKIRAKIILHSISFSIFRFVAPIVTGDYPPVMRERVGKRLPKFTPEEAKLVKGSYDFIGMNYYTTNWAAYKPTPPCTPPTYYTDQEVEFFSKY